MEVLNLPYKSVVLFIACGTMMFAIVFLFAKRQITRFALKSNRVPHAAIGSNAPKSLKKRIEWHLNRVGDITCEPVLLSTTLSEQAETQNCHYYFRMKAIDALKDFDTERHKLYPDAKRKIGQESLRTYLLEQRQHKKGCLSGIRLEIIDKFAAIYEHARHDPAEFKQENYQEFMDLMNHLIDYMQKQSDYQNNTDDITEAVNHGITPLTPSPLNNSPQVMHTEPHPPATTNSTATVTPISRTSSVQDPKRNAFTPELAKRPGFFSEDLHLGYRPHVAVDEEESGLLLESQDSGSSLSSLADSEVTFRRLGKRQGEESYV